MDRGAWWAIVHGVAKSWTRLSDFTILSTFYSALYEKKKFFRMVPKNYKGEKQPEFRNITAIFTPYTTRIWEYIYIFYSFYDRLLLYFLF